jgi:hypothetical protein
MASRRGPDNSVRVAFVGTVRGQTVANVKYFQLTTSSTPAQADLDAWLTTIGTQFKTSFQSQLPSDYTFSYAKAVMFVPGGSELVSTYTPTAWSGTFASGTVTGATSGVISWSSGVYWRGGKPRTYFPVGSGAISGGNDLLTSAYRTSLATAATGFRTGANTATSGAITGTAFGFVSFQSGNAERGTPLFFAITGAVIHPRVGTQRRRNGKWQN